MSQSTPLNTSTKTLRAASLSLGKKEQKQSSDVTTMGINNNHNTNNTVQNITNNNTKDLNDDLLRSSSVDSIDSAEDEGKDTTMHLT